MVQAARIDYGDGRLPALSARASGIRASRCRAGRCRSTGARTASRSGTTRRCSPTNASPAATRRKTRTASSRMLAHKLGARYEARPAPATRTPSTTCGASAGCRSTSIRSNRELDDELERVRLRARVRRRGLRRRDRATCCRSRRERDLPMQPPNWVSGPWFFRDDRMYLIPGDSPMGYRLPLESLPWVSTAWTFRTSIRRTRLRRPAPLRSAPAVARCSTAAARYAAGRRLATAGEAGTARRLAALRPATTGSRHRSRDPTARTDPAQPCARRVRVSGITPHARCASRRAIRRARPGRRSQRTVGSGAPAACLHAAARPSSRTIWNCSPPIEATAAELRHAGRASKATRRRTIRA